MTMTKGHHSPTGVWMAADFRDNLIIDRHDPLFASMRATRRKQLQSASSEDAVTWNVFRSLRQVTPAVWLPELFGAAFPALRAPHCEHATVALWQSVPPPPSLTVDLDESEAEVDVVIEAPTWVWFVEAKLRGDAGAGTATRRDRNQVLRYLDVGTYYAGVRPFYFSLLVADRARSGAGAAAVAEYASLSRPRELLAEHRPDQLRNLAGVSLLTWAHLGEVLGDAADDALREDERAYAARARDWLRDRGIIDRAG
jgi:hypothetical protein